MGEDLTHGQKLALRVILEEVRDEEIRLARFRCNALMARAGVHPQQALLHAIVDWEFALKDYAKRVCAE